MKDSLKILIMTMSLWGVEVHGSRELWNISTIELAEKIENAISSQAGGEVSSLCFYADIRDLHHEDVLTKESALAICTLNAYIDCFVYLKSFLMCVFYQDTIGLTECIRRFNRGIIDMVNEACLNEAKFKQQNSKQNPNWLQWLKELRTEVGADELYLIDEWAAPLVDDTLDYSQYAAVVTNNKAKLLAICSELKDDIIARLDEVNDLKNELEKLRIIFEKLKALNFDAKR